MNGNPALDGGFILMRYKDKIFNILETARKNEHSKKGYKKLVLKGKQSNG